MCCYIGDTSYPSFGRDDVVVIRAENGNIVVQYIIVEARDFRNYKVGCITCVMYFQSTDTQPQ
ncbi:MAG: hypothetical protein ABI358_10365 [Ginsengibacter sp.]